MIGEDARARMREAAARYPDPRSAMLPALHIAQAEEGYITPEGVDAVAQALDLRPDEVDSVVSFYSMYFRQRPGRHVVKVCTSISCYLRGADALLEHLEQRLDISRGGTSADGAVTLLGTECLASCGTAPVLQVDDEFVENVTLSGADSLIERLRQTAGGAGSLDGIREHAAGSMATDPIPGREA